MVFFGGRIHAVGSGSASTSDAEAEWTRARECMVAEQLAAPGRGITSPRVLKVMERVPRHEFVSAPQRDQAYDDHPLPIGYGQTISQPYIVALMTERLHLLPTDRVLEIGTGCGYQAAVLAGLVREVYSIEIIPELARAAASTLRRLGFTNVQVKEGNGYLGWPEQAPFEAMIVTCAPEAIPKPLLSQLREGGRMMVPVGDRAEQNLILLCKGRSHLTEEAVLPVRFVPMTGEWMK